MLGRCLEHGSFGLGMRKPRKRCDERLRNWIDRIAAKKFADEGRAQAALYRSAGGLKESAATLECALMTLVDEPCQCVEGLLRAGRAVQASDDKVEFWFKCANLANDFAKGLDDSAQGRERD